MTVKPDENLKLDAVIGTYVQIFGRQPHVKEIDQWSKAVEDSDLSLGKMALLLLGSGEQEEKMGFNINNADIPTQIKQLYLGVLGREADAEGEKFWGGHLKNKTTTLENIASAIVNSPEMETHYKPVSEWDFAID
ncbi:MAG: DUF4214 domain-containing protein [Methylococcales bacterium]|nr:DUF4214 domain-containing protein [Methylococcales bacterium]